MSLLSVAGCGIATAWLRGAPLICLALLASRSMRSSSASMRHFVLTTGVAAGLAAALLGVAGRPFAGAPARIALPLTVTDTLAVADGTLRPLFGALWLAGVAMAVLRLGHGALELRNLRRRSSLLPPGEIATLAESLFLEAGMRRRVTVRLCRRGGLPVTWGVLRPVILLPAEALRWPLDLVRTVLLHETAHIHRRDALTVLLFNACRTIFWFDPLSWLAVRRARLEGERACDDAVLGAAVDPRMFAQALVALAARRQEWAERQIASGIAGTTLEQRVNAILDVRCRRGGPATTAAVALLVAFLAAALLLGTVRTVAAWTPYAEAYGIPQSLARLILTSAAEQGLDPKLAFALVRTESGFRPHAVSRTGAVGLTQILPATAQQIDSRLTERELLDPHTNLRAGFALLQRHMNRYRGDVFTALTAYSLGARELERRRAAGVPLPSDYAGLVLASRIDP